ncbi:MAG: hypothetical protein ACREXX_07745 [Gammaproteobacteria bacterium]
MRNLTLLDDSLCHYVTPLPRTPRALAGAALSRQGALARSRRQAPFEKYPHLLGGEPHGVSKVIRALVHLHVKHPRRKRITQVLG